MQWTISLCLLLIPSVAVMSFQPVGLSEKTIQKLAQIRFASFSEMPMKDRVVVITGAAGGIGQELCRVSHELGATVVALDRDTDGLMALCGKLGDGIVPLPTQHEDLASVADSANRISHQFDRVDILINNAGMTYRDRSLVSKHDKDLAFTVNYLSHVLLTEMLLPRLLSVRHSRVIQLTSTYHWKVDGSELIPLIDGRGPMAYQADTKKQSTKHVERSYGNTKLAQLWHAQMLTQEHGLNVVCACPTWAGTGIGGEDSRDFLETMAFPVTGGPGITSALNAMFRTDEELGREALSGRCLVANSRMLDYVPFKHGIMTSRWATKLGWRDRMVDFVGMILLLGQRFTHEPFTLQAGSPESTNNPQAMKALYEWSRNEIKEWM